MKKLITIIFVFFTVLGFSQDSEIYKAVFENQKNLKFFDWMDEGIKENMIYYKVLKINFILHSKTFKYEHNIYYSKDLIDSLKLLSKGDYHSETRILNAKKNSELFTFDEQDYLYNEALKAKTQKVVINSNKVKLINEIPLDDSFYFCASNIVYSENKKKAYLIVDAYGNGHLYGYSFFIFALNNNKWEQIYEDVNIVF